MKKVGSYIAAAVGEFLENNPKLAHLDDNFQWEFYLIESEQVNAWCIPGGKVAFSYTKEEKGLAVVMEHEIAHAIADHGVKK